ncbi:MAG TPA: hypothetical protein VGC87_18880 [Pyrinomonadaceae bacterium]|jgi:hypothetical protein
MLPWVQVSCGGDKDTASGFDLARGGDRALWVVPLLMLAVLLLGLMRGWKRSAFAFSLVSLAGGLVSAYLINQKRADVEDGLGVIGGRITGWLWLGLFLSLVVAASAVVPYLKRSRSP